MFGVDHLYDEFMTMSTEELEAKLYELYELHNASEIENVKIGLQRAYIMKILKDRETGRNV